MVLVRRREYALKVKEYLAELGLRITRLVGHGVGRTDGGMAVKEQDKILHNIRQHEYDVIVATSVAEEGLDIPECEVSTKYGRLKSYWSRINVIVPRMCLYR